LQKEENAERNLTVKGFRTFIENSKIIDIAIEASVISSGELLEQAERFEFADGARVGGDGDLDSLI
jgi:hypothetical protein